MGKKKVKNKKENSSPSAVNKETVAESNSKVNSNQNASKTAKPASKATKGQFNNSNTLDMWWYHLTRSKSFDDVISAFNEKGMSLFAAIPMILLLVSPVLQTLWIIMDNDINVYGRIYPHTYYILKLMDYIIVPVGLCASVINFLKEKKENSGKNRSKGYWVKQYLPLVIYVIAAVWMVVTSLINGLDEVALTGYGEFTVDTDDGTVTKYIRNESLFTYLEYFLIYFGSSFLVTNEDIKKFLVRFNLICSSIVAFIAVIAVNTDALLTFYPRTDGLGMNFWNANHYGYYVAIAIVCGLGLVCFEEDYRYKAIAAVLTVLNGYVLMKNNTFGAMLAVGVGAFVLAIGMAASKRVKARYVLIAFVLFIGVCLLIPRVRANIANTYSDVVGLLSGSNNVHAGSGRWGLWTGMIDLFNKYPRSWFIGCGIDKYAAEYHVSAGLTRPHNEIMEKIYFFGVPLAIMYLAGIVVICVRAVKKRKTISAMTITALAAAFTYFASSMVGVSMFYSSPFFFTFLGLSWVRDEDEEEAKEN